MEYDGTCDFNQKLGKNWRPDLQKLSHEMTSLAPIKYVGTNKDPPQGKTKRQNKNRDVAKLHREAEKKIDEENTQDQAKDLHRAPDRFKAFTIGDRQRKLNEHH